MGGNPISFLKRLARSEAGNALAIVAASVIPIIGVLGGGLDMSRVYLTKSRMQQACDASVLAGRRSMVGLNWGTSNQDVATQFYRTNFPDGTLGTQAVDLRFTADANGGITANASTLLPMTLMRVFKIDDMPIAVTCKAELQLPNSDIMFVLDTTGSMAETNPGDTTSRIVAMRASVQAFYQTLENARTSGSVIRYGFVPYSESVNVGKLLKRDWMVDTWTYQSRRPNLPTETTTTTTSTDKTTTNGPVTVVSGSVQTIKSNLPLEDCTAPANAMTINKTENLATRSTPYPGGDEQVEVDKQRTRNGSTYSVGISGGQCVLTETRYTMYIDKWTQTTIPVGSTTTSTSTKYYWDYGPISYDVTPLKGTLATGLMAGGKIAATINNNHGVRQVTWAGCIEERDTVTGTDYTNAYDMDIDMVPTSDPRTRWRPALPHLVFARTAMTSYNLNTLTRITNNYQNVGDYMSGTYAVCPYTAAKLAQITPTQLSTYLGMLTPSGQTYHDIGLIWGARLLSPTGIFGNENATAANGGTIARHMIFMTDGDTDTEVNHYDAYGWPALDRRRSTALQTKAQQDATVAGRTAAICTAAKAKGITLWVIAFGTSLTSLLNDCASPGRAYQANNTAELNARFAEIATQIAQLRIVD
ncbi:MAG: pilus assembly protein [Sphingobium sp.]|nr:pilus assembly protein [Sphingobium sp.]